MKRIALLAASLFAFAALGACSSGTNPSDTGGDQEEVRGAGKICGGFAGLRCATGFTCKLSGTHPDASGTCVAAAPGEEGGICGTIAGIACKAGLACKFPSHSSGPPPGAMGLPRPADAGHGGPPPGTMGLPMPDESGTCARVGPPPGAVGLPMH